MKRLPRQLNVFFFFLSVYRLDYYNNQYKYEKKYQIDSNYHDNFVSDTYCLSWISKNKLKEFGLRSKDYLPYFQKFTIKFSDKTMTRCERFQWKPEAHQFFERFLELDIPEYDEFKVLLRTKKDENSCKLSAWRVYLFQEQLVVFYLTHGRDIPLILYWY